MLAAPKPVVRRRVLSKYKRVHYHSRVLVTRRAALNTILVGGIGTAVGEGAYGLAYARHQIQVVRATVPVSGLPPALEGLRIGLITDLHHSEMVPSQDVVRASELMMAEQPDLIVLGGDYVTWGDRSFVIPCSEALGTLEAPLGVYAVLGNHDDDRHMPAALNARGIWCCAMLARPCSRAASRSNWSASDSGRSASVTSRGSYVARRAQQFFSPTIPVDSPKPPRSAFRWCCRATRTAVRSCCPVRRHRRTEVSGDRRRGAS